MQNYALSSRVAIILRLRSAFAEATADKLAIPDRLRLIANCGGEALEVDPLEIFGT